MAVVWKFRRNAVDVDLNAGFDAGWNTSVWNPSVAAVTGNRLPPLVTESMRLLPDDTSHDNLAGEFQTMDNYRWLGREYIQDRTQQYPLWLHAKMNNETGERRALVYSCGLKWLSAQTDTCDLVERNAAAVQATVVRGPFWEKTSATATGSAAGLSTLGGAFDYTAGGGADVVGDAPARIDLMTLKANNSLYQAWLGFRSAAKHPGLANFQPLWECETGTNGTDTASAGDVLCSGANKKACTFATDASWDWRVRMNSDLYIAGNEAENYGRFVVLLRARTSAAGTTAEVQLRQSYAGAVVTVQGPIVEVDYLAGDFIIVNLGTFIVPLRDLHGITIAHYADTYDDTYWWLWARRTAGAGNLDLDCLIFIPADELFAYSIAPYSPTRATLISQTPEGTWAPGCINTTLNEMADIPLQAIEGMGVPVGDGRCYLVGADNVGRHFITFTWDGTLALYPRWYNLRGAE